jgi:hypothetical protein
MSSTAKASLLNFANVAFVGQYIPARVGSLFMLSQSSHGVFPEASSKVFGRIVQYQCFSRKAECDRVSNAASQSVQHESLPAEIG